MLAAAGAINAQNTNAAIEKIRAHYIDVSEKARLTESHEEQGRFGELILNELVINKLDHPWRAVGVYKQGFKFFYKASGDEKRLYPDQLLLVKTERKISNRSYNEEFLFSTDGSLMFYFQKAVGDDEVPAERRVYFSGTRAIRIVEDGKTRDALLPKDATTVRETAALARKVKEVFNGSIKL